MAIQFITGRSGAGKSYRLYQHIIQESQKYPEKQYYVVVPEQFTMQTQLDLVKMHPNHGISNIDVLSFMRLAYRVFEEQGGLKRKVLEDTGKSMLVRKVVSEKEEQLQIFKNYAKKPGYISEIKSLLSEFFQYEIDIETLDEMEQLAKDKPMLQRKLQDMQVVYEGFQELLEEKYIPTEEVLEVLISQLEHTELMQNTVLVLDGFTGFTPVQYQLLRKLLVLCEEVLVTVTIDPKESAAYQQEEIALFHSSREVIDKLTKIATEEKVEVEKEFALTDAVPYRFRSNSKLACLEQNLFAYQVNPYPKYQRTFTGEEDRGDVRLFTAGNMEGEVEFAVREIGKLIRNEGYRYRDIAVVTGDMEIYSRLLGNAFLKEEIPCFVDYKKDIMGNPLVELLRTVFQLFLRNFDYESVFRYLRCGLVELNADCADVAKEHEDKNAEIVDKMENHVLALGIKGLKRWKEPWTRLHKTKQMTEEEETSQLAYLNANREKMMESLLNLNMTFGKKRHTVKDYTIALHSFLTEMNIYQKLKEYQQRFEEEGELLLAKEYDQVYELVLEIFDKMVQLLGDEEVSLQEYSELLETGFAEVKVGLIPPGVDQIVVGDIERTRLKDIKALFFLGVNEGIVPSAGEKGGILSELERELLVKNQFSLAPTARQTVFTQQYYFYLNLTKPQEYLFMSYHKSDAEGKPVLPSSLIRNVKKIFPDLVEEEEIRILPEETLPEEAWEQLVGTSFGKKYLLSGLRMIGEAELSDWWKELFTFYVKQGKWQEQMQRLISGVGFVNEENNLSKQVANALYGKELKNSVTRVERYAACAFAHFIQYGLRLRERYEFQFGGVDFGNVFHQVLSQFPGELEKQGYTWRTADQEQMDAVVEACVKRMQETYENGILESSEQNIYLVERMSRIIKRTIWALAQQIKDSSFDPKGYELQFKFMDGLASARIDLGEDRTLRLKGQIDRLDVCEEEDKVYIKIVDYKSGKMKFDIVNLYYGLQMQLVVYMNAAKEMQQEKYKEKTIVPAGIFYYNIDDPVVDRASQEKVDEALLKELKMNGLVNRDSHVIGLLDNVFGSGESLNASTKSKYIPVETIKDGSLSKRSSVAPSEYFEIMGEYAQKKIEKDATEILDGRIEISPYRKAKKTACDYCAYRAICNFDTKLPGNEYREQKEMSTDEVWLAMQKAIKEEKGGNTDGE